MNTNKLYSNKIGENLSKPDARKLAKWWNANTDGYYFVHMDENHPRRYKVLKSTKLTTTNH